MSGKTAYTKTAQNQPTAHDTTTPPRQSEMHDAKPHLPSIPDRSRTQNDPRLCAQMIQAARAPEDSTHSTVQTSSHVPNAQPPIAVCFLYFASNYLLRTFHSSNHHHRHHNSTLYHNVSKTDSVTSSIPRINAPSGHQVPCTQRAVLGKLLPA